MSDDKETSHALVLRKSEEGLSRWQEHRRELDRVRARELEFRGEHEATVALVDLATGESDGLVLPARGTVYVYEGRGARIDLGASAEPAKDWIVRGHDLVVGVEHFSFDRQLSRIEFLRELTSLISLDLRNTLVGDLEPLRALTSLASLDLSGAKVRDLEPLRALTSLASLFLAYTPVSDLNPLRALTNLTSLTLMDTQVRDLEPLRALTSLTELGLEGTQVSDLEPLSALTCLTKLRLRTQVNDLEPLRALTCLTSLSLNHTEVSDLEPLSGLTSLTWLYLYGTKVSEGQHEALCRALPRCRIYLLVEADPDDE